MRLAFVCPRLHEPGTVGGAETLLHSLAVEASRLGHEVEFLVTCAKNHFTWANELRAPSAPELTPVQYFRARFA